MYNVELNELSRLGHAESVKLKHYRRAVSLYGYRDSVSLRCWREYEAAHSAYAAYRDRVADMVTARANSIIDAIWNEGLHAFMVETVDSAEGYAPCQYITLAANRDEAFRKALGVMAISEHITRVDLIV